MLSITSVDVWTFSSCGFDVVTDSSTLIGSIVVVVVFSVVVVVVVVGLRRLLVTETDGEPEEIWFSTGLASTDRAVLDCGLLRRAPGRLPPKDSTPSLAAGISFVSTAIEAAVVVVVVAGEGRRPPPILRLPPRVAAVEEGSAVEVDADDVSGRIVVVVEGSIVVVELL